MAELKPCPFCGGDARQERYKRRMLSAFVVYYVECSVCGIRTSVNLDKEHAIEAWNRRTKIEVNFYDKEETYTNCTVQVLTNTVTGDVSVGWWKNGGKADEP